MNNSWDDMTYREIEEYDYDGSEAGMGIYERNITEIMNLIGYRYANFYQLLISRGMSQGGIRDIFRYIVYFTVSNVDMYAGNETQKAYAIFYALRSQEPWVFSSFATTGLPAATLDSIIFTIILFTIRRISTPVARYTT
jgi:hypothetical protein